LGSTSSKAGLSDKPFRFIFAISQNPRPGDGMPLELFAETVLSVSCGPTLCGFSASALRGDQAVIFYLF